MGVVLCGGSKALQALGESCGEVLGSSRLGYIILQCVLLWQGVCLAVVLLGSSKVRQALEEGC